MAQVLECTLFTKQMEHKMIEKKKAWKDDNDLKIIFSVGQVKPPDLHHETISKGLPRLASENGFELSGSPLQIKRIEIVDWVKHMKVVNSPSKV